jgi:hypothetical protein
MTHLISVSETDPDVHRLLNVFVWVYGNAYRQFQAARGKAPTYRVADSDKADNFARWRKVMYSLTRNGYNPLQVVRHEMLRFIMLNEPEPPRLGALSRVQIDQDTLREESQAAARSTLMGDLAKMSRFQTTIHNLFAEQPTDEQLMEAALEHVNSRVLRAVTLANGGGMSVIDRDVWRAALAEYLEHPEVYSELAGGQITRELHKMKTYEWLQSCLG